MQFKTRIKELKARYDVTQDDLGETGEREKRNHTLLGKRQNNPSLMLTHQIAKTLKTTIDDLFIFEDE